METGSDMAAIVKALARQNIRRIIGLSMAGLSGEFPTALEKFTSIIYQLAMYKVNVRRATFYANLI